METVVSIKNLILVLVVSLIIGSGIGIIQFEQRQTELLNQHANETDLFESPIENITVPVEPEPEPLPELDPPAPEPIPNPEPEPPTPDPEPEPEPTPQTPDSEPEPEPPAPEPDSEPEPTPQTPDSEPDSEQEPSPSLPITDPEPEPPSKIEIDIIATCTKITDGDTFELSNGDIIRLADVDTPERGQTGYQEASDFLRSLIYGKTVYLEIDDVYGTDFEGSGSRLVCVVYRKSGLNVNLQLLNEEYAQLDNYYNEFDPDAWNINNEFDLSNSRSIRESNPTPNPEPTPEPEPTPDPPEPTPPTLDPEPEPEPEPVPEPEPDPYEEWLKEGPFIGSKNSNKYHKTSGCWAADNILPENMRTFNTRKKAINADYVACKICKP